MIYADIFPNSGHHYYFSDIMMEYPGHSGPSEEEHVHGKVLTELGRAPLLDYNPGVDKPTLEALRGELPKICGISSWKRVPGKPWLRYRFGIRSYPFEVSPQDLQAGDEGSRSGIRKDSFEVRHYSVLGIWFAIESNVGDIKRGYVQRRTANVGENDPRQRMAGSQGPYVAKASNELTEMEVRVDFPGLPGKIPEEYRKISVAWTKPSGQPIFVDLIVDFGNSRTIVLALEDFKRPATSFPQICRPIAFIPERERVTVRSRNSRSLDDQLVDSWFVLNEPQFASLEADEHATVPVVERIETEARPASIFRRAKPTMEVSIDEYMPQMFVELSPAMMGSRARQLLSEIDVAAGGRYFMSSPKRYVWNSDRLEQDPGSAWTMVRNLWSDPLPRGALPGLKGEVLRYFPFDGRSWGIKDPPTGWDLARRPPNNPDLAEQPPSDMMSMAALAIVENAYRHIVSKDWSRGNEPNLSRVLRQIRVTYPSGWTSDEIAAYKEKWQKAIDVFSVSRFTDLRVVSDGGELPELKMDMDEAVASQLPMVYSMIQDMSRRGRHWCELYGRPDSRGRSTVRVMSIDIGGGTSDTSIVEYRDDGEGNTDLHTMLLLRESSTVAGDHLVKEIIERVLLPGIATKFGGNEEELERFASLFRTPAKYIAEKQQWSRITRLVLVPLVIKWLSELAGDKLGKDDGSASTPADAGCDGRALEELNEFARIEGLGDILLDRETAVPADKAMLEETVKQTFERFIKNHASMISAYDCDLVILTGKPSELPALRRLLERHLPLSPNHIIMAKGLQTGDWFPLARNGRVGDAKLMTAVGAALARAIFLTRIPNFRLALSTSFQQRYCWFIMDSQQQGQGDDADENILLADDEKIRVSEQALEFDEHEHNKITRKIPSSTYIGRSVFPRGGLVEPVYHLRLRKRDIAHENQSFDLMVTFERVSTGGEGSTESLKVSSVSGQDPAGRAISLEDIELKLCTMAQGGDHWLDNGRFAMDSRGSRAIG